MLGTTLAIKPPKSTLSPTCDQSQHGEKSTFWRSDFMGRASPRQAFFSRFSRKALECIHGTEDGRPKIMLTGCNHAELIGFGRPAILCPDLAHKIIDSKDFPSISGSPGLPRWVADIVRVKLVGAGLDTAVWTRAMKRIAGGNNRGLEGNVLDAFLHLFFDSTPTPSQWILGLILLIVLITLSRMF
ncbi:hypothetical protein AG1IA_04091 [Rhizoctonia solani AG-1 IA]|uniref:Uncharacterized protein n=1 Tax=Thanatephorus cucumeris (strain AG1-IA) TaxID=983506 RepID=L8WYJ0_THACA|nr:hypothetical protein AG1IA_04091 [Rhizoctonia solani AG-1 IA]